MTSSNSILKNSVRRTTELVGQDHTGLRKLFHSRGWRKWGDHRRAEREFRQLQVAYAAGLAVPMPREVRRLEEGWCLTMDRVSNGRPLDRMLEAEPESASKELGEQLGRLLAQLVHLGMLHGDLHLGNLVVDAESKVWLVDFGQARTRDKQALLADREDLLVLLGSLRELTDRELRARLVTTYLKCVGAERAENSVPALLELELAARRMRRCTVLRNLGRWTRESGVAQRLSVAGRSEILARRTRSPASTLLTESGEAASRAWLTAARLFEHRVPTLAPVRLLLQPKLVAEFELSAGVLPLSEARATHTELALVESYGALFGNLHDRGLQIDELQEADLFVGEAGELYLHPRVHLAELDLQATPPVPKSPSFLPSAAEAALRASYFSTSRDHARETDREPAASKPGAPSS